MAHFAKIENKKVTQVIVVNNETLENMEYPDSESVGIAFCQSLFGEDTQWLQTSYNAKFRGRFAGVGYSYDKDKDEFVVPEPVDSTPAS
jgi:hypothetical protein